MAPLVAVLMGGESRERDISRVTGTAVARALADRGFRVTLLDTQHGAVPLAGGECPRIGGKPPEHAGEGDGIVPSGFLAVSTLMDSLSRVDVVFVALHGGWGEDGTIQALFEMAGIPYTGSGVLGSALAMDKDRAKRIFRSSGVPTPDWRLLPCPGNRRPPDDEILASAKELGDDLVVKPNTEGSTVGLSVVRRGGDLARAVRFAARYGDGVLLETYVPGRELTVAILGDRALPIVEIIPEGGIYDYEAKYTKGKSRYEVPAALPAELASEIRESSLRAFEALGCEGFARVDYRLSSDGAHRCLEVNTIPGMTPLSLVPMAAKEEGISFEELVERIVEMGIARGTRRGRSSAEVET